MTEAEKYSELKDFITKLKKSRALLPDTIGSLEETNILNDSTINDKIMYESRNQSFNLQNLVSFGQK
jgi:hypothetical protein